MSPGVARSSVTSHHQSSQGGKTRMREIPHLISFPLPVSPPLTSSPHLPFHPDPLFFPYFPFPPTTSLSQPSHSHPVPPAHPLLSLPAAKWPPQIQLRGLGSAVSSPSGVRRAAPASNEFLWHYSPGNAYGDSNFWLTSFGEEVKFHRSSTGKKT